MIWEVEGQPVSMAGISPILAGMSRIAPVYTPPAQRGQGYGAAVAAAASQVAIDRGAEEVLLFTDLINPTSNALYQRLGYEEVGDWAVFSLETNKSGTTRRH